MRNLKIVGASLLVVSVVLFAAGRWPMGCVAVAMAVIAFIMQEHYSA